MELYASYTYLSMSAYFAREDVSLHGFSKFFYNNSNDEKDHAAKFIEYQTLRGGNVWLKNVSRPKRHNWGSAITAVEAALALEKKVNRSLLKIHRVAERHHDAQLASFIEEKFLKEQVESIKQLADLLTDLKKAGFGFGIHIVDKELMHA